MKSLTCLSLATLILLAPSAYADCPNCYHDQQPLDPDKGFSADGRVKVVVGIAVGASNAAWSNPP